MNNDLKSHEQFDYELAMIIVKTHSPIVWRAVKRYVEKLLKENEEEKSE